MKMAEQTSESKEAEEMRRAFLGALPVAVIGISATMVVLTFKWMYRRCFPGPDIV